MDLGRQRAYTGVRALPIEELVKENCFYSVFLPGNDQLGRKWAELIFALYAPLTNYYTIHRIKSLIHRINHLERPIHSLLLPHSSIK